MEEVSRDKLGHIHRQHLILISIPIYSDPLSLDLLSDKCTNTQFDRDGEKALLCSFSGLFISVRECFKLHYICVTPMVHQFGSRDQICTIRLQKNTGYTV